MDTLRAVAMTAEAARRIRAAGGPARVHSAYARTVNVVLDGLDETGWVSLHGPGPIPAPFGVACAALSPTPGLDGAPVRIEREALVVDGTFRVCLAGARLRETSVPTPAPMPPLDACLRTSGLGLLPVTAAVLQGTATPSEPLARLAAPALAALALATRGRDAAAAITAARALIGLGPGLTPAGDDCLVGWLAGLWAGGDSGHALVASTGPVLLAAARERTGPLSRAFLAAAVAGAFAEPVRAFVARPDAARLAALLTLGATSGRDLLAGYCLARAA